MSPADDELRYGNAKAARQTMSPASQRRSTTRPCFGIRVVTAEFRTAIAARPGTMMYHLVTRFRRNQRASAFHMPSLTSAFALGFWLRCARGLLSWSIARRWQRRIARVHSKSAIEFLDSLLLCRDDLILLLDPCAQHFDKSPHCRRHLIQQFQRYLRHPCQGWVIADSPEFSKTNLKL